MRIAACRNLGLALAVISVISITPGPAEASAETDFKAGIAAYKTKNYGTASAFLQRAATSGMSSTSLWMYLGHAYTGAGDRKHAVDAYSSLVSNFRGSAEATQALQYIQRLDPAAARRVANPSAAAVPGVMAPGTPAPASVAKAPFKDRIIVVAGKMGHPNVSQSMRDAVKSAVAKLPAPIYKILDEGGATVNLLPNIEDKWPGSGDGEKPRSPGTTMGEEPGRTYGRDVHVYERKKFKGSNELGEARSTHEIIDCLYHELGHAVDDCCGVYSNDPKLKAQFQLDLDDMPSNVRSQIEYFTEPSEGCAEVVGALLGADLENATTCLQYLPRTKTWLKAKLKI